MERIPFGRTGHASTRVIFGAAALRPTLLDRARARYLAAVTLGSAAPVLLMPTATPVAESAPGGAIAVPAR